MIVASSNIREPAGLFLHSLMSSSNVPAGGGHWTPEACAARAKAACKASKSSVHYRPAPYNAHGYGARYGKGCEKGYGKRRSPTAEEAQRTWCQQWGIDDYHDDNRQLKADWVAEVSEGKFVVADQKDLGEWFTPVATEQRWHWCKNDNRVGTIQFGKNGMLKATMGANEHQGLWQICASDTPWQICASESCAMKVSFFRCHHTLALTNEGDDMSFKVKSRWFIDGREMYRKGTSHLSGYVDWSATSTVATTDDNTYF